MEQGSGHLRTLASFLDKLALSQNSPTKSMMLPARSKASRNPSLLRASHAVVARPYPEESGYGEDGGREDKNSDEQRRS